MSIPTYSLIGKRVEKLKLSLDILKSNRAITVILDASGTKICGEEEWKVKIHGRSTPRKWVKLHLAVDAETCEIVAECITQSTVADSSVTKKLLDKVPGKIEVVMGDGAYDRSGCREVIKKTKAKALIPPPRNARYRGTSSERDQAIAAIRWLGGDKEAKSI
ncbi:MAG: transposase [Chlamydiae bacterium]|nr:transposase [Chlamydiota bacterium]